MQDPSAEGYYPWSPYNYVVCNPPVVIDPDGRDTFRINGNQELTIAQGGKDALFLAVSTGYSLSDLFQNLNGVIDALGGGNFEVGEGGSLLQYREFSIDGVKDLASIAVGESGSGPDEAQGIASAVLNQFGFDRQSGDVTLNDVDRVARFATVYAKYPPEDKFTPEEIAGSPYNTIQQLSNHVFFDVNNTRNWGRDRIRGALRAVQYGDHPHAPGVTHWEGNAHLSRNSWHNRQVRRGDLIHVAPIPGNSVIGRSTFYRATAQGRHLVLRNR